jgi:porphobilinogen synthase
MPYPIVQPRRLRQSEAIRRLVRETRLSVDQLIFPLFVRPGKRVRAPIPSMPGQFQFSVDQLVEEAKDAAALRIPAVLLFGLGEAKDEKASRAWAKDGILQQAVRALKAAVPELLVITDVCLCPWTTHGHCGIVRTGHGTGGTGQGKKKKTAFQPKTERDYWVDNDATLEVLAKVAVSHAQAGADMVAPSDMMDGRVGAIRTALDREGQARVALMSYAAKFASTFYGPFREAVESGPAFGDRKSYQLDPANLEEALREAALDIEEGADIVMVKPALAYLDVIARLKQRFGHPVAAFNVSGEYAMVKAAAARGWLAERPTWMEMLLAMRRAGADMLITYWAKDAAKTFQQS